MGMPLIAYEPNTMRADAQGVARLAASISEEYARAGYSLTLRQLYYQFVGRGHTANWSTGHNTERSYKRLGSIVDKARMSGLIDWNHLTDPTRVLRGAAHWEAPGDVINSAAHSYRNDKWIGQPNRVEVWVEKEALADVVSRAATASDVNYFACKGYTSSSAMWRAGRRIASYLRVGQSVTILHLGDHDPSGIDMTRDIRDRLQTFVRHDVPMLAEYLDVRRIALNMDQVERYNPPPNPAKLTDSRGEAYVQQYGTESWELDALPPDVLVALVNEHIDELIDLRMYQSAERAERLDRDRLELAARNWEEIAAHIDDTYGD
jgi:hypothetical protein